MSDILESSFIANAVLTGLILFLNTGLFLASLCVCRRMGDQARGFVTWLKVTFPLFGGFLFFNTIASILAVLVLHDILFSILSYNVCWEIGVFFYMITKASLVVTFSSAIRGILFARNSTPATAASPYRLVGLIFFVLMIVLSIASLGLLLYFDIERDFMIGDHGNKIWGAVNIMIFVASASLLGLSGSLLTKVKQFPHLKKAATILLVASVFFFIENLFKVIWIGLYGGLTRSSTVEFPRFGPIITFIFSTVPLFLTLATLFHLGRSKDALASSAIAGVPGVQPVQYAGQPAVPNHVYAYGQAPGQPSWQPGMYYYPQQPIQQQQIPAATYAPVMSELPPQSTVQPAPNTISSMSTTPIHSPAPTPIPHISELSQSGGKP